MAGFAELLAAPAEAEYWKAWYPQVPYTGALEQQRELVRLRDMEEQNLRNMEMGKTSQGSEAQQNQYARNAVPTMGAEGVAQAAPMQATAPGAVQMPELDQPVKMGIMDQLGPIQVIGGVPADRPALSMPPYFPPGVPPQELGWKPQVAGPAGAQPPVPGGGMSPLPALSMPPYFPPSVAPQEPPAGLQRAPQAPAAPMAPPPTPQGGEPQQRVIIEQGDPVSKWKGWLENLRRPEVMGPLQTFFTALSAPLAPWETPGSRIGRASMMMQMHQEMMQQNVLDRPREEAMKDLELEGKQGEVAKNKALGRKATVEADIAEATKDPVIRKASEDLENAIRTGKVKDQELALRTLEVELKKMFGEREAQAALDNIKSQIETRAGQLKVAQQNANTMAERNDIARQVADQKGKKLSEMSDAEALNQINMLTQMFRLPRGGGEVSAAQESGADFLTWYKERGGDTDDYVATIRKLQAKGYDIKFGTSQNSQIGTGMSGVPPKKPSYTLDAQGNLK